MSAKTKGKKRNRQQGNPQKAAVRNTAEAENEIMQKSIDPPVKRSTKPLFMRIIMLAIAAVMILGIVMGAVAGNAGSFF